MYLELLQRRLINMGWYSGRADLLTMKLEGEFEGFYGRASEAWEHRLTLEIGKIDFSKREFPGIKIVGKRMNRSFEDLAKEAYEYLDRWEENENN